MRKAYEIFKPLYNIVLIALLAIFLLFIFYKTDNLHSKRYLSHHYISEGVQETGALNLVTSVLYDYRAFDTLGEATVILTASSTLAFLAPLKKGAMVGDNYTTIVYQAIISLLPFFAVLAGYLISFGHLNPGGGFVGGVILALIPIVSTISYGIDFSEYKFKPKIKSLLEDMGSIGFILLGLLGIFTGSNFLSNGNADFSLGASGQLFSAGLIPYLNLMIGIKVGVDLAIIFNSLFKEE